nr:immunoglobulin heavy chain junction region [Macaca mulatta]
CASHYYSGPYYYDYW